MHLRKILFLFAGFALLVGIGPAPARAVTYANLTPIASSSQAPWMVSLWEIDSQQDRDPQGFICGGALIDPYTVITAAHCMDAAAASSFVVVRAQNRSSDYGEVLMPRDVVVHPRYKRGSFVNDLAVVSLYVPATASAYLRIPSASQAKTLLKTTTVLFGWGRTETGVLPAKLQRATQKDLTRAAGKWYAGFNANLQLGAGQIVNGKRFIGACSGDSGGPLVGSTRTARFLLGVVSFGPTTGCKATAPRVFTRISAYRGWIASQQSILTAQRAASAVDISRLLYVGTSANPLPTTTGVATDLRPMRTQTAGFVTESTGIAQSDIASLAVHSYTHADGLADVSVDVIDKQPWSVDGCGFGAAANTSGTSTVLLQLRAATPAEKGTWQTELEFRYTVNSGTCLPAEGAAVQIIAYNGVTIPSQCNAGIGWTSDHQLQFSLTRQCFRAPAATYIRVQQLTADVWDVEPGSDLWAGPFNVTEPLVGG